MKKGLSKFKVLVPMLMCVLAFSMVLLTGCGHTHAMSYIEKSASTCKTYGTAAHYHCDTCGKDYADKDGKKELSQQDMKLPLDTNAHEYVYDYIVTVTVPASEQGGTQTTEDKVVGTWDVTTQKWVDDNEFEVAEGSDIVSGAKYQNYHCGLCGEAGTPETDKETVSAGGEGYPYQVKTESDLLQVATEGGYAVLEADVEIKGAVNIAKATHIALNTHKITYNKEAADNTSASTDRKNYAMFHITDNASFIGNGVIEYVVANTQLTAEQIEQGRVITILDGARVKLDKVTIESDVRGIALFSKLNLEIKDCPIITKQEAIGLNNTKGPEADGDIEVTVDGSRLESTDECAIFLPNLAKISLKNNTHVVGKSAAVYVMMGTLDVDATSDLHATKSDFTVRTASDVSETGPNEGTKDGAAIVIRTNYYYNKKAASQTDYVLGNALNLNITDWEKVTSASGVKVAIYNWKNDSSFIHQAKSLTSPTLTAKDQFEEIVLKLAGVSEKKLFVCENTANSNNVTAIKEVTLTPYTWIETTAAGSAEGGDVSGSTTTKTTHTYLAVTEIGENAATAGVIYEITVGPNSEGQQSTTVTATKGSYEITTSGNVTKITLTFNEAKSYTIGADNVLTLIVEDGN